MTKLKDTYPLYLANQAWSGNADLEVTDKFTGEVAFRVAMARPEQIEAGIAAAVEAAEPMVQCGGLLQIQARREGSRLWRPWSVVPWRSSV